MLFRQNILNLQYIQTYTEGILANTDHVVLDSFPGNMCVNQFGVKGQFDVSPLHINTNDHAYHQLTNMKQ